MMKKINIKLLLGAVLLLIMVSCEDYLDVNDNPNAPTSAEVDLVLPAAIVSSASVASTYNNYGGHFGGYIANAGGFSGFGNLFNYDLTPANYNGLWTATYQDPLKDLKYVMDNTNGYKTSVDGVDANMMYYALAQIMTAVNYQRLVDAFNEVAYTQALQGLDNLAPSYDPGPLVYQDLYVRLDSSVLLLDTALNHLDRVINLREDTDPLFSEYDDQVEQIHAWQKYANTLMLRILIRLTDYDVLDAFVAEKFTKLNAYVAGTYPVGHELEGQPLPGFLDVDAIVNPGYELNRPNPTWATWGRTVAGALANSSRIPTTFSFAFFNGAKLSDNGRGSVIFPSFPGATPNNQLGNENNAPTIITGTPAWYSGGVRGILKGPAMGQPLMLAAESYFLQAEAQLRGLIPGSYQTSFTAGVTSSFQYLYKDAAEANTATVAFPTLVANYIADNAGEYLVDISLATSFDERLEAIITQKWIALLMINNDEAWNEYRRTGYPVTVPLGGATVDMAALLSNSPRPDRLPTRVKNPSSEQAYNASHYKDVNQFSDRIFWDPN